VVSELTGKSATAMAGALIGGERRGQVLADLAIGRMRTSGKLADLSQALTGRFTDHHAALCRLHLDRIALFSTAAGGLEAKIAVKAAPYRRELDLLKSAGGFGDTVAQAWLAEIGPAPHEYFASHEKLASWVTLCPGNYISAGKRAHGRTGNLHQADAGAGRLGGDQDRGPAAGVACRRLVVARRAISASSDVVSWPGRNRLPPGFAGSPSSPRHFNVPGGAVPVEAQAGFEVAGHHHGMMNAARHSTRGWQAASRCHTGMR